MEQVSDKLDWTITSLRFISPEIIISVGILALIVLGLIKASKGLSRLLSLIILVVSTSSLFLHLGIEEPIRLFGGMLRWDSFNFYLRCLIGVSGILIVLLSPRQFISRHSSEYFVMTLSITLGAQLLVMSEHFAMAIISLELMSIPAYILSGFNFNKQSAEASMKYFVYGSVATALLIFGVSWLYGFSDTLNFTSISFAEKLKFHDNEVFLAAGFLVIAGLLFKMAATPFHFWAPDIYQATPMPVLALFSTVPKIAAGSFFFKLIIALDLSGGTRYDWQGILTVISILTLTVGNFSALVQKNVKRLMAYSSIGQAGFLLTALAGLTLSSAQFFLFYGTILVISTVLVFLTLHYFEYLFGAVSVEDFSGLGRQLPEMSALLTLAMVSLVGLPITAGFTAKLFIFTGLLNAWSESGKNVLLWLFAFGLLNTVVALYYYLRIPYYLFLKRGPQKQMNDERPLLPILFGVFLGFILLWLFFQPDSLMGWINRINFELR